MITKAKDIDIPCIQQISHKTWLDAYKEILSMPHSRTTELRYKIWQAGKLHKVPAQ